MNQTTPFAKFIMIFAAIAGIFFIGRSFGKEENTPKIPENTETTPTKRLTNASSAISDNDAQPIATFDVAPKAIAYLEENFPLRANQVNWQERKYGYEAIFEKSGRTYEVEFDKTGNWLETELEDVPAIEIPNKIIQTVKRDYPNHRIQEFEIEFTPKGTFYEIEMVSGTQETELYYDSQGKKTENMNEDR
jgi:uncharacterized membrane protein YkoI